MGFLPILSKWVGAPWLLPRRSCFPGPLGQSLAATLGRFCDDVSEEELASPDGNNSDGEDGAESLFGGCGNGEFFAFQIKKNKKNMASDFC